MRIYYRKAYKDLNGFWVNHNAFLDEADIVSNKNNNRMMDRQFRIMILRFSPCCVSLKLNVYFLKCFVFFFVIVTIWLILFFSEHLTFFFNKSSQLKAIC